LETETGKRREKTRGEGVFEFRPIGGEDVGKILQSRGVHHSGDQKHGWGPRFVNKLTRKKRGNSEKNSGFALVSAMDIEAQMSRLQQQKIGSYVNFQNRDAREGIASLGGAPLWVRGGVESCPLLSELE